MTCWLFGFFGRGMEKETIVMISGDSLKHSQKCRREVEKYGGNKADQTPEKALS